MAITIKFKHANEIVGFLNIVREEQKKTAPRTGPDVITTAALLGDAAKDILRIAFGLEKTSKADTFDKLIAVAKRLDPDADTQGYG